jgi:predicted cupin superfamily sugar epimerase
MNKILLVKVKAVSASRAAARSAKGLLLATAFALACPGATEEIPMTRSSTYPVTTPSAADLIEALGLEGHVEGGYFRRTYEASEKPRVDAGAGERFSMTSIFYLLTAEGPVGHFHRNRSDIVHYFHLGDPIEYFLIHEDGRLERIVMGPDPTRGQLLQLTVPGGIWKASRLLPGAIGYGLISEAVTPGFDYADMTLGVTSALVAAYPQHADIILPLSREDVLPGKADE